MKKGIKNMTNNLRKISQDLRAFAKKTKEFKYSDSALITFLISGTLSVTNNLLAAGETGIESQKQAISNSIKDMQQSFKRTREENDKLLKKSNLELIQLMEQGDHVVKSPWNSWDSGIGYTYNDWNGYYKGRGNKTEGRIFSRENTLAKYSYNRNNSMTYGATRLALNSDVIETPVEIEVDASLRTVSINKQAPTFRPTTPGGGLPPFEPLMVTPPVISPKVVTISQVPTAPPTEVSYQDVPNWNFGYNVDNVLSNNAIMAQLELLTGTYNTYFPGVGSNVFFNFNGATENTAYTPSGGATFLSGKAQVTLTSVITVNAIGNNGGGELNTIYYLGNNAASGNPESKLVNEATVNIYGNKVAAVNIDNVQSNGDVTFENKGKITGHAQSGTFVDSGGNTLTGAAPQNHVFGAFTYGYSGADRIDNASQGEVIFHAPGSAG